jgi:hypothetical protein
MIHGRPDDTCDHRRYQRSATSHVRISRFCRDKNRMRNAPRAKSRIPCSTLSAAFAGRVALMSAQAFSTTRSLHLCAGADRLLRHPANHISWCILPSPRAFLDRCSGRLFDTLGRRTMIATTYIVSGTAALSGYLFSIGALSAQGQTIAWMVIFFYRRRRRRHLTVMRPSA